MNSTKLKSRSAVGVALSRNCGWHSTRAVSERRLPRRVRDPTRPHLWGRFTPLISTRVGDSRGTPLAENQNTLRRSLILHDPEGLCAATT